MERKIIDNSTKLFCQTIALRLTQCSLKQVADEELTEVQLDCVRFVHLHPEPSVGKIADGLEVSDAAAAKLIDRLVKKKLMTREEDPVDRRVLKIKLTEAGLKMLEVIETFEANELDAIIQRMAPQDVDALQVGLVAFIKAALQKPEDLEKICLRCGVEHFSECPGNLLYREFTGKDKESV